MSIGADSHERWNEKVSPCFSTFQRLLKNQVIARTLQLCIEILNGTWWKLHNNSKEWLVKVKECNARDILCSANNSVAKKPQEWLKFHYSQKREAFFNCKHAKSGYFSCSGCVCFCHDGKVKFQCVSLFLIILYATHQTACGCSAWVAVIIDLLTSVASSLELLYDYLSWRKRGGERQAANVGNFTHISSAHVQSRVETIYVMCVHGFNYLFIRWKWFVWCVTLTVPWRFTHTHSTAHFPL